MGPDLEFKELPSIASLSTKGNGSVQRETKDQFKCATNFDNIMSQIEVSHGSHEHGVNLDIEVNIVDIKDSSAAVEVEARCENATESMSSFGNSISEKDNGSTSDTEVESKFFDEALNSKDRTRKKKKVTDEWRDFIRPLMWRCKWVELQIKEFQSQALKYDRELAQVEQKKQLNYELIMAEGPETRSQPFSITTPKNRVMERKIRKRLEETTDITSYMRQHNLFSYFEGKKSAANNARACMIHDFSNRGKKEKVDDGSVPQDGWPSLELREGEDLVENTLRKIDVLQLQAREIKARMEKVIFENPVKFSSLNVLSLGTHSEENAALHHINEGTLPVKSSPISSPPASDYHNGKLMPGSTARNQGEVLLPDMINSTVRSQFAVSFENDGILIHNEAVQEEMQGLRSSGTLLTEKSDEITEIHIPKIEPQQLPEAHVQFAGKSLPKSRTNLSTKKRKRGKRRGHPTKR